MHLESLSRAFGRIQKKLRHLKSSKEPAHRNGLPSQSSMNTTGLAAIPNELLLQILQDLDIASQASLSVTCKRFRKDIQLNSSQLGRCGRWMMKCHGEHDYIEKHGQLPWDMLRACAFCKLTNQHMSFLVSTFPAFHMIPDHGIKALNIFETKDPYTRYCARHIPKRIEYNPAINSRPRKNRRTCERDVWVMTKEPACAHCGLRLRFKRSPGTVRLECEQCIETCTICSSRGDVSLPVFTRYGFSKAWDPKYMKFFKFVRRRETGHKLEVKEPFISLYTEVLDHTHFASLGKCHACLMGGGFLPAEQDEPFSWGRGNEGGEEKDLEQGSRDCEDCRKKGIALLLGE